MSSTELLVDKINQKSVFSSNNYFENDKSYTIYINHARWHRCLRLDGLRVGGNRCAQLAEIS